MLFKNKGVGYVSFLDHRVVTDTVDWQLALWL